MGLQSSFNQVVGVGLGAAKVKQMGDAEINKARQITRAREEEKTKGVADRKALRVGNKAKKVVEQPAQKAQVSLAARKIVVQKPSRKAIIKSLGMKKVGGNR